MERMEAQCQKYRVIQRLCEEDETDYHRYLFSLLDSLSTNSMDPIQFILTELKRYEPQAVQAIDHTLQFICLMTRLRRSLLLPVLQRNSPYDPLRGGGVDGLSA